MALSIFDKFRISQPLGDIQLAESDPAKPVERYLRNWEAIGNTKISHGIGALALVAILVALPILASIAEADQAISGFLFTAEFAAAAALVLLAISYTLRVRNLYRLLHSPHRLVEAFYTVEIRGEGAALKPALQSLFAKLTRGDWFKFMKALHEHSPEAAGRYICTNPFLQEARKDLPGLYREFRTIETLRTLAHEQGFRITDEELDRVYKVISHPYVSPDLSKRQTRDDFMKLLVLDREELVKIAERHGLYSEPVIDSLYEVATTDYPQPRHLVAEFSEELHLLLVTYLKAEGIGEINWHYAGRWIPLELIDQEGGPLPKPRLSEPLVTLEEIGIPSRKLQYAAPLYSLGLAVVLLLLGTAIHIWGGELLNTPLFGQLGGVSVTDLTLVLLLAASSLKISSALQRAWEQNYTLELA